MAKNDQRDRLKKRSLSPGGGEPTVEGTVGGAHYDAPSKPRAANDTSDKVAGLAKEFHDTEDAKIAEATLGQHETERQAAQGAKPGEAPEEDRRRVLVEKETGINVFPRDAGGRTSDMADSKP